MATGFPVKGTGGATTYSANSVLSSSDLNDGFGSLNLLFNAQNSAGKNAIINGGQDIWQRGTSFTVNTSIYTADRWVLGGTNYGCTRESTVVPQGFTYSMKLLSTASTTFYVNQAIESLNADNLAGQVVTLSAYVSGSVAVGMSFFVGWSASVDNAASGTWTYLPTITGTSGTAGSFNRISGQVTIPTTAKSVIVSIANTAAIASGVSVYLAGVQLELGSSATPFSRAGGSSGGELALCQKYYWRENWDAQTLYAIFGSGSALSTTSTLLTIQFPVQMRVKPPVLDYPTPVGTYFNVVDANSGGGAATSIGQDANQTTSYQGAINAAVASGLTQFRPYLLRGNNSTGAYLGWSAEL